MKLSSLNWRTFAHRGLPNPLYFRWIWHASRSESKFVSRLWLLGIRGTFMKAIVYAKYGPPDVLQHPLNEVAEACRYFGEGHARGKVVVIVE